MLFMFPKFSPLEVLPVHFDRVQDICQEAGVTQVSQIHLSFLAWRDDEAIQIVGRSGYASQYIFDPAPSSEDPNRRVLRDQVLLRYAKPIPAWSENPKWNK
jgi:hypothetical protein